MKLDRAILVFGCLSCELRVLPRSWLDREIALQADQQSSVASSDRYARPRSVQGLLGVRRSERWQALQS